VIKIGADTGECVGEGVGDRVGEAVGNRVGEAVGDCVGEAVGNRVGEAVGDRVGEAVGDRVGGAVGNGVGEAVGHCIGEAVGDCVKGVATGDEVGSGLQVPQAMGQPILARIPSSLFFPQRLFFFDIQLQSTLLFVFFQVSLLAQEHVLHAALQLTFARVLSLPFTRQRLKGTLATQSHFFFGFLFLAQLGESVHATS